MQHPSLNNLLKEGSDSESEMSDIDSEKARDCMKYCELQSPEALMNAKEGDFTLVSKSSFRYTEE